MLFWYLHFKKICSGKSLSMMFNSVREPWLLYSCITGMSWHVFISQIFAAGKGQHMSCPQDRIWEYQENRWWEDDHLFSQILFIHFSPIIQRTLEDKDQRQALANQYLVLGHVEIFFGDTIITHKQTQPAQNMQGSETMTISTRAWT